MNWYNLTPAQYADGLRYRAERSDECAARQEADRKPWSHGEAERYRRQARRCRAMALLCDNSDAITAGDVDFMRLSDPTFPRQDEERVVSEVEKRFGKGG